jgi:hypothetical protein
MNAASTTAPAPITPATIPPIAPLEMEASMELEASLELEEAEVLLCVEAADGDIVVTTTCVVGMTDGTVYTVEVPLVLSGGGGGT